MDRSRVGVTSPRAHRVRSIAQRFPGFAILSPRSYRSRPGANAWTGANDFSGAAFLPRRDRHGYPINRLFAATNVGSIYERSDTQTTGASLYVCSQTGSGTYSWENVQTSGTSPLPVFNAAGTAMSDHMVTGRNSFFASTATITSGRCGRVYQRDQLCLHC